VIEFISILVLTFALALVVLGVVTAWLERERERWEGLALVVVGLLTGSGYAFLGSRFSLRLFGRLIVRVNLPALMGTAFTYTAGVLGGVALAVGLFLWATDRFRNQVGRTVVAFALAGAALTVIAVLLTTTFAR